MIRMNFAGAALVSVVLRDVFQTLCHPTRHGDLSRLVMTVPWRPASHLPLRRRAAGFGAVATALAPGWKARR
ncbi:hypothetical protein AB0D94_32645 [Streptomyces sp. NPDC048255]|uniref:hypothetical protein n=1 Tax=Streptomyces sp. NPDC048255 TaxID=3154713 RepID=UPI00340F3FB3